MPNLGDDKNARKYLKPCRHPECLKLTENVKDPLEGWTDCIKM